jgi:hypothetical protein
MTSSRASISKGGGDEKSFWFMTANSNSIFMLCVCRFDNNRGIMQRVRNLWSITQKFPHKTLSLHYSRTPLSVRLANATFIKKSIFAHFECSPYKSLFDENCKIIPYVTACFLSTYASPSKRILGGLEYVFLIKSSRNALFPHINMIDREQFQYIEKIKFIERN